MDGKLAIDGWIERMAKNCKETEILLMLVLMTGGKLSHFSEIMLKNMLVFRQHLLVLEIIFKLLLLVKGFMICVDVVCWW